MTFNLEIYSARQQACTKDSVQAEKHMYKNNHLSTITAIGSMHGAGDFSFNLHAQTDTCGSTGSA